LSVPKTDGEEEPVGRPDEGPLPTTATDVLVVPAAAVETLEREVVELR
jgi:hypothetical protein